MTDPLYSDEAIIRSVTYHGKAGHKISLELDPAGWERLKGMETTRCMMVLVPIQNDGQPDPDAKPRAPITEEAATRAPTPADKPKRIPIGDMTRVAQAGMLCHDDRFIQFLSQQYEMAVNTKRPIAEDAAVFVREWCKVTSRKQLDTEPDRGKVWDMLRAEYDVWTGKIGAPR